MRNIKRIMASISAQFTDLVDQIENHEAVAASALRRFRADIQEAKVQAKLLEKELAQADKSMADAQKNAEIWKGRAKNYSESERDKALECVRRFKMHQKEGEFWTGKKSELTEHLEQLRRQISSVESKYQDMKLEFQKHVSRDRTAQIYSSAGVAGAGSGSRADENLNDVFERWDKKLIRMEVGSEPNFCEADELASQLERQEEALDLEATLDELKKEVK